MSLTERAPAAARLHELFDGVRLTPTQRRLAQYIMRNAQEAMHLSGSELSARANVSQPAVTRLAVALGFEGTAGLRAALRSIVLDAGPFAAPAEGVVESFRHASVDQAIAHLRGLRDDSELGERIDHAGRVLARSEPLVVLGLRVSAGLAGQFGYLASKVHPAVIVIDEGGSRMLDWLHQAHMSGAAALLVYGLPRYPRELFTAIETARAWKMSVVSISDSPFSPLAELSDVALYAGVEAELVFDSHPAILMLTTLLLNALSDAEPDRTQRRLEEFEAYAAATRLFHL